MCTHLASRGEATAVNVQLIGMLTNLLILGQLWYAQVMPMQAFAGTVVVTAVVGAVGAMRARGKVGHREWLAFEALVSLAGVLAVPQVRMGCARWDA